MADLDFRCWVSNVRMKKSWTTMRSAGNENSLQQDKHHDKCRQILQIVSIWSFAHVFLDRPCLRLDASVQVKTTWKILVFGIWIWWIWFDDVSCVIFWSKPWSGPIIRRKKMHLWAVSPARSYLWRTRTQTLKWRPGVSHISPRGRKNLKVLSWPPFWYRDII